MSIWIQAGVAAACEDVTIFSAHRPRPAFPGRRGSTVGSVAFVPLSESESESESFYSVILQTQETSAKTYMVAVAEATWTKKYLHECMYVKVKLVNTSKS